MKFNITIEKMTKALILNLTRRGERGEVEGFEYPR